MYSLIQGYKFAVKFSSLGVIITKLERCKHDVTSSLSEASSLSEQTYGNNIQPKTNLCL